MIKHKHQQLYDLLSEELRRGTWPCNEKLPNLKELAARYNVSINVASKAVELLKEAHLVSVKVGDGIYSETSGQAELVDFKYSGERLFGQYAGAKTLRILMQDNTEFQLTFWNGVFDAITLENPDIELQVSYNMAENKIPGISISESLPRNILPAPGFAERRWFPQISDMSSAMIFTRGFLYRRRN